MSDSNQPQRPASGLPPPPPPAPHPPPPPGAAPPPPGAAAPPPPGAAAPVPPFAGPVADGAGDRRSRLAAANRVSGALLVVGVVVVLVGSALPWAGLEEGLARQLDLGTTASGWSTLDGSVGDGPIFLVLAMALAVFAVLALRGVVNLGTKIAAISVSVVTLLVCLLEFGSIASENDDLSGFGFTDPFSYEYGLFVLLAGSLVTTVASVMLRRRPPS